MCLVSFVPTKNSIVITSSRDEDTERGKPVVIRNWKSHHKTLNFPRDVKGGTWIGYDHLNNFLVILNGARTRHQRADSYRKSRGLIVLDLLNAQNIPAAWKDVDLTNIEPFTLLHYSSIGELWEWIWDGDNKKTNQLDTKKGHCWMSSTLYTPQEWDTMKIKFKNSLPRLTNPDQIRAFHLANRYEQKTTGVIYPSIRTVSNTTVQFQDSSIFFNYLDLRG